MKFFIVIVIGISILFGAVDINTASKKELISLNGIGAKKAEAVIAYREVNCFKSVKELTKVKGIGNKTIEKNMSELSASPCNK
ncbi:MAG: competence protein ComEA [Sulfurimonas sp.]|jgi:competence protein ComEA